MTLTDTQAQFAAMVGKLLIYADGLRDHRVRLSWAYRDERANSAIGGHPKSLHLSRLAIDLILDAKDSSGEWYWVRASEPYEILGHYWEAMGGAWGGRFAKPDGGHFSLEWRGVK